MKLYAVDVNGNIAECSLFYAKKESQNTYSLTFKYSQTMKKITSLKDNAEFKISTRSRAATYTKQTVDKENEVVIATSNSSKRTYKFSPAKMVYA